MEHDTYSKICLVLFRQDFLLIAAFTNTSSFSKICTVLFRQDFLLIAAFTHINHFTVAVISLSLSLQDTTALVK